MNVEGRIDEMSWQIRLLANADRIQNKTTFRLLAYVLGARWGWRPDRVPRFEGPFSVKAAKDKLEVGRVFGYIVEKVGITDRDHTIKSKHYIGTTIEVRDLFRRLADAAKLTDVERIEFFKLIGQAIAGDDERAKNTYLGGNLKEV